MDSIFGIFLYNKIQTISTTTLTYSHILELGFIFIFGFILKNTQTLKTHYEKLKFKINTYLYNYRYLEINGQTITDNYGITRTNYPEAFLVISWYMSLKNINKNMLSFSKSTNGKLYYNDLELPDILLETIDTDFINSFTSDYEKLDPNIDVYIVRYKNEVKSEKGTVSIVDHTMFLRSSKNIDLVNYLNLLIIRYKTHMRNLSANKIYHFIYRGADKDGKLMFCDNLLNNLENKINFESFDNLFHSHKENIINDINRLHNIDYYKKTGLKRKKGYLFYGEPGTGKTATVMAISNMDDRHIIEISLSRICTNEEMEKIMSLKEINGISFTKDKIIYLFDEIDIKTDIGSSSKDTIKEDTIKEDKTKEEIKEDNIKDSVNKYADFKMNMIDKVSNTLNIGTILSRFDGVGNYNGLIIIATTNNKDKINPALTRDLRLTPLYFTYSRQIDIINIIENYYDVKLSDLQKKEIPDIESKLTPASIITIAEKHENNITGFLNELKKRQDELRATI